MNHAHGASNTHRFQALLLGACLVTCLTSCTPMQRLVKKDTEANLGPAWTSTITFGMPETFDGVPMTFLVDRGGRLHGLYTSRDGEVVYMTGEGESWDDETLAKVESSDITVRMRLDGNGGVHVVYPDHALYTPSTPLKYVYRESNGWEHIELAKIEDNGWFSDEFIIDIDIDSVGRPWVAYLSAQDEIRLLRMGEAGWTEVSSLPVTGRVRNLAIVLDGSDRPVVVFDYRESVRLQALDVALQELVSLMLIDLGRTSAPASNMFIDKQTLVLARWLDGGWETSEVAAGTRYQYSDTWTNVIDTGAFHGGYFGLSIDGDDRVHLVFDADDGVMHYSCEECRSGTQGGWDHDVVAPEGWKLAGPQAFSLTREGGKGVLGYRYAEDGNSCSISYYHQDSGGDWVDDLVLNKSRFLVGSVAHDEDGTPVIGLMGRGLRVLKPIGGATSP